EGRWFEPSRAHKSKQGFIRVSAFYFPAVPIQIPAAPIPKNLKFAGIMFRHRGKARTLKHNLAIASLLSLVAGIVNVVGFLAIQQLTTNVTGHFAFMMEEVLRWDPWRALM